MSRKDTKKPESIRYLLSADRKLQKLSLKRISERARRAGATAHASRPKKPATAQASPIKEKDATQRPWGFSSRAIALGVIGVVAAAALMAAGDPSSSPTDVPAAQAPAVTPMVKAPTEQKLKARTLSESTPKPVAVVPAPKANAADVAAITITGCLQQDAKRFWLKDASGANAPTSRSWKSGFLKRSSSRVDVVGAASTLKLSSYVGQRVAATGVLAERELRAHSVRRIAASCN